MFRNIIRQSCLFNDFGRGERGLKEKGEAGAYSKIAAFEGSRGITVYITSINVHLYRNIRTFLGILAKCRGHPTYVDKVFSLKVMQKYRETGGYSGGMQGEYSGGIQGGYRTNTQGGIQG